MNVALNDEIYAYLEIQNVLFGNRENYSLFLKTRGNDEATCIDLIQQLKNTNKNEATKHFLTIKNKMDESYERVGDEFVIYKPLFLKSTQSEDKIRNIELKFEKLNCELTFI